MTRPTTGLQRRPTTPPPEAPAPTRRDPADLPVHAVLLIVALTAGVTGQGAYYAEGQRLMALLFAVALVFSLTVRPSSSMTTWRGPRRVAAALAAWALVSGAVTGHLAAAGSFVALIAGVLVVLVLCSRTAPRQREALAGAVVALGALVALAGWVGVAWRITPWALEDQALWRAASPLTYANATAGFLAAAALVALGRLVRAPGRPLEAVAVCLLLMGVGATLSRAGLLSLALGIAVLCALLGLRRVVVGASGPVLGAAVALAGLAPSMPARLPARPALAVAALVLGVATAGGLAAVRSRGRKWGMATVVVPAVLIVALVISGWSAVSSIAEPRATLASPDRSGEVRAALDVARDNLLFGAGPGGATLTWPSRDGGTLVARYAHNEYLQMLAELGVAGLVLVAGLIAALALMVWRGRSSAPSPELWAGVVAGLTALAFHSAFDFLWHIPVIPIVAVVLAGLTLETTGEEAL